MAVIRCPHCNRYISSLVKTCPECGKAITVEETPSPHTAADVNPESDVVLDKVPSQEDTCEPVEEPADEATTMAVEKDATPLALPTAEPSVQTTTKTGTLRQKISLRRILFLLFFLIIGIGICCFLYVDHRRDVQYEQREFDRLNGCTDLLRYEDYLIRFPEGKHADEVKKMYETAKREQQEFFRQTADGNREALEAFIKANPTSPYVKVCEMRIDSLDWDDAVSANSTASYAFYLDKHPEGIFKEAALATKNKLAKLEVTNEERSMLSGSLDTFLSAMTSGDEARVDALISSPLNFCGQPDATGSQVITFYTENFHKDDILGVHFTVKGGLGIQKIPSEYDGMYNYNINAQLDATLNRSAVDSLTVQAWSISAQLTPDRKFKYVNLLKQ